MRWYGPAMGVPLVALMLACGGEPAADDLEMDGAEAEAVDGMGVMAPDTMTVPDTMMGPPDAMMPDTGGTR